MIHYEHYKDQFKPATVREGMLHVGYLGNDPKKGVPLDLALMFPLCGIVMRRHRNQ